MTRTGRLVVVEGQQFSVREVDVPDPAPGAVLLRQELAGICGTDLHNWQKGLPSPTLMGHEFTGVIEALGQGVTTDFLGNPIHEGDRVVVHPRNLGVAYGFRGPESPFSGGFGDYLLLDPGSCLIKTATPAQVAVLAEPFAIGIHAVMRGRVQLGDTVIVQGAGAIGLVTMICAKLSGAARLILIGGPGPRLELAKRLGAQVTVDIDEFPDPVLRREFVMAQTPRGEGADVVFECAGFLPAFTEGLEYVRQDGTFVEVGHFVDIGDTVVSPHRHFLRKNLRFEGIWGSRYEHFIRGMAILENQELPYGDMVSHVLPLAHAADGFDALNGTYRLGGETVVKIALASHAG